MRRPGVAAALCLTVIAGSAVVAAVTDDVADLPPNVILVVTDDQSYDTIVADPPAMPWLASQMSEPSNGWFSFTNAVVTTPMCCPSRASILTGLYARGTGVTSNSDGYDLDESDTIAVALHGAGYRTAMIGKYLNGYPWDRGAYVPEGWDRWLAKTNDSLSSTYYGYELVDQSDPRLVGTAPADYVTDVLGREAVRFVDGVPEGLPWFLYFAPPAPHEPWTPAPRHQAYAARAAPAPPPLADLNDVEGKPGWVKELPPVTREDLDALQLARSAQRATLLAVDQWLRALVTAVARRGELGNTVIIFTSDNGYHFGEHRWRGKQTPYEPSVHVPLAIRFPGSSGGIHDDLVANIDLAPTIAELAGTSLGSASGISIVPVLTGGQMPARGGLAITWEGSADVPSWSALRLDDSVYVRNSDGVEEFYDLRSDPDQLNNSFAGLSTSQVSRLRLMLASLLIRYRPPG